MHHHNYYNQKRKDIYQNQRPNSISKIPNTANLAILKNNGNGQKSAGQLEDQNNLKLKNSQANYVSQN